MFNKVEKRAVKEQAEILGKYLDTYGTMLEMCQQFFQSYNKLDLYMMAIYAGDIHCMLQYAEVLGKINKLEEIITGKLVECDEDSFKFYITGKINYLLFHEFKRQKNGNIINTGKSYKKKFNLPRRIVIEEIIPLHTGGDVAKEKEI